MIDFMTAPEGKAWYGRVIRDVAPILSEQANPQGNALENWLGFRPGPRSITDPDTLASILNRHSANAIYQEQLRAYRADQNNGGLQGIEKPDRNAIYESFGITSSTGLSSRRDVNDPPKPPRSHHAGGNRRERE